MNPDKINSLPYIDPDNIKAAIVIFVILMVMYFLNTIIKKLLEHKLKNKIIEKGITGSLATTVLQNDNKKHENIKWFIILIGLGVGLLTVNYTLPLGLHSFAIMAFSIALSFLTYHFYLQRTSQ